MLGRARRRGPGVALVQASVDGLPFPDGVFDLCTTYNGLHCLPGPAAAVTEIAGACGPAACCGGAPW